MRGEFPPDHRAVALRVVRGQAHVLVEKEGAHAREGQPLLTVSADQLLVGQHRRGSRGQAQGRPVSRRPTGDGRGDDVGDHPPAVGGAGEDDDLHVSGPPWRWGCGWRCWGGRWWGDWGWWGGGG